MSNAGFLSAWYSRRIASSKVRLRTITRYRSRRVLSSTVPPRSVRSDAMSPCGNAPPAAAAASALGGAGRRRRGGPRPRRSASTAPRAAGYAEVTPQTHAARSPGCAANRPDDAPPTCRCVRKAPTRAAGVVTSSVACASDPSLVSWLARPDTLAGPTEHPAFTGAGASPSPAMTAATSAATSAASPGGAAGHGHADVEVAQVLVDGAASRWRGAAPARRCAAHAARVHLTRGPLARARSRRRMRSAKPGGRACGARRAASASSSAGSRPGRQTAPSRTSRSIPRPGCWRLGAVPACRAFCTSADTFPPLDRRETVTHGGKRGPWLPSGPGG